MDGRERPTYAQGERILGLIQYEFFLNVTLPRADHYNARSARWRGFPC